MVKWRSEQPTRDLYAGVAITFLLGSFVYLIVTGHNELVGPWMMNAALVTILGAETYSKD